jgi:protein-tyrosine phosphatase
LNLLFICSRNQWRSPTAEAIFKNRNGLFTKSAGTEPSARIRVNGKHLSWADLIFVMEKKHKQRITETFGDILSGKEIIVLDIPDEYRYMDDELIETLNSLIEPYLT